MPIRQLLERLKALRGDTYRLHGRELVYMPVSDLDEVIRHIDMELAIVGDRLMEPEQSRMTFDNEHWDVV